VFWSAAVVVIGGSLAGIVGGLLANRTTSRSNDKINENGDRNVAP
jgi:hypothetical protein